MDKVIRLLAIALAFAALIGCGSKLTYKHTADEDKALEQLRNETPEQKIERIQKGPMPQSVKESMIKSIKEENGLK